MRKITLLILIVGCVSDSYGQRTLNKIFEASKGKWEIPVRKYTKLSDNFLTVNKSTSTCAGLLDSMLVITTDSAYYVKALHNGEVLMALEIDTLVFIVLVKFGDYCIVYNPLKKLSVKQGDQINAGDTIGLLSPDLDGNFNLEIHLSFKGKDLCAKNWINWKPKTKTIEACATTSEYVYQKSN